MTGTNIKYCYNKNNLPEDILTFIDDKFYNFVKELLGQETADLLKLQCINNVPSFLFSENICNIIEFGGDSVEIDTLRKKTSFVFKDGTYHVKIGIKNNLNYLNKLLSLKVEEENKKIRNLQKTTNSTSSIEGDGIDPALPPSRTTINSPLPSPSIETEANSTSQSVKRITTTVQTPHQLSKQIPTTSPDQIVAINSRSLVFMTKEDHTEFLLTLLNKWIESNKDLHLRQIDCAISCTCGVQIKLRKRGGKFQVTNFYKHLRARSCCMMEEKKRHHNEENQPSNNISSNNGIKKINDNQRATSQQPLSETETNVPTSPLHQEDVILLSTAKTAKRNSSHLGVASSRQSSSKRNKT